MGFNPMSPNGNKRPILNGFDTDQMDFALSDEPSIPPLGPLPTPEPIVLSNQGKNDLPLFAHSLH